MRWYSLIVLLRIDDPNLPREIRHRIVIVSISIALIRGIADFIPALAASAAPDQPFHQYAYLVIPASPH